MEHSIKHKRIPMSLTSGVVLRIVNAARNGDAQPTNPMVQVVQIKSLESGSGQKRFRLLLSDGEHSIQAMLATQHNEAVARGEIGEFSVVQLTEYICNEVKGRQIVIILGFAPVSNAGSKIGNPSPVETASSTAQPQQAPRPPQHQPQYTSSRPSMNAQTNQRIMPIRGINPYSNKWVIKARVTSKGTVRHWNKGPGNTGSLFPATSSTTRAARFAPHSSKKLLTNSTTSSRWIACIRLPTVAPRSLTASSPTSTLRTSSTLAAMPSSCPVATTRQLSAFS